MSNIVNLVPIIDRRKWLESRHEQSWKLHEKYGERFQKYGLKHDLQFAQQWMDKAMGFGYEIDVLIGRVKRDVA